jgi:hypothetical protein
MTAWKRHYARRDAEVVAGRMLRAIPSKRLVRELVAWMRPSVERAIKLKRTGR